MSSIVSPDYGHTWHFHSPGLEPWIMGILRNSKIDFERVLDVGCGLGFWGYLIKASISNNLFVVGIDISQTKLKRLNSFRIYDALICADAAHLSLKEGGFSLLISIETLHGLPNIERVVKHLEKFVNKNGLIVLAMPVEKAQVENLLSLGYEVLAYCLRGFCLVSINSGKVVQYRSFVGKIVSPLLCMAYKLLNLRIVRYVIGVKLKT